MHYIYLDLETLYFIQTVIPVSLASDNIVLFNSLTDVTMVAMVALIAFMDSKTDEIIFKIICY